MQETTPYPRRWWTLAVLCLSLLIIGLDNTILNVALPTLVVDLSASASQLQWIVDSYVLVFAGLLLVAGNIGDRFGRKRALDFGLLVFAAGSILSAYAGSANQLIATRALMGIGGAFIMPSTLSILTNIFPPRERPRAIAIWTATAGVAIPFGPVIGGWLLEHFWWGSIFLVNIPIALLAIAAGWLLIPESRDPQAAGLDPVGAILSIVGLATLLYAIIEAPSEGWTSPATIIALIAATLILGAFAFWEARVERPLLDVHLFKNPRFGAAVLSISLVFFALFGSMFFITQYLQFVLGYTALEAGIRIIPVALGIMTAAPASAKLAEHFGTKRVVAAGLTIVAVGLIVMSTVSTKSGYERILIALPVIGFGMGMTMAPATESVMGSVPKANAGVGSAVNDTARQVGGALGVAVLGSLLSTSYSSSMSETAASLPAPLAGPVRDSVGAAVQIAQQLSGDQGELLRLTAFSAFVDAMSLTVLVAAGVALLGTLSALLWLPAREHATDTEDSEDQSESAAAPARIRQREESLHS